MLRYVQSVSMPTFIMIISMFASISALFFFSSMECTTARSFSKLHHFFMVALRVCFSAFLGFSRWCWCWCLPCAGVVSQVLGFGPQARALALLRCNCSGRAPSG